MDKTEAVQRKFTKRLKGCKDMISLQGSVIFICIS